MDPLTTPLYSQSEVARILRTAPSTFSRWTQGYVTPSGRAMDPLVSGVPHGKGVKVPFLALAEAYVIRTLLKTGVSMPHIRDTVEAIRRNLDMEYALASRRLKTDGAVIVWEHEKDTGEESPLVVLANGQIVFREVVRDNLQTIHYGSEYANRLAIPLNDKGVQVAVDPKSSFGQPTLAGTRVRVSDVLGRLKAGEPPASIAYDYDLPRSTVELLQPMAA